MKVLGDQQQLRDAPVELFYADDGVMFESIAFFLSVYVRDVLKLLICLWASINVQLAFTNVSWVFYVCLDSPAPSS